MREMIDPIHQEHVSALSWHQQRQQFRNDALEMLRLREGLPEVVDGRYLTPDGKRYSLATGAVKAVGAGLSMYDAVTEAAKLATGGFTVKGPGTREFEQEFSDLLRDAATYAQAQTVKHDLAENDIVTRTYLPEMPNETLEEEQKLDRWLQNYIAQGASK